MIETIKSCLIERDIRLHVGSRINYLYKPNWIQGRFCYCCFYPLYFNISMYSFFPRISLCFCNMTHFQSSYRLHNVLLAWYNFTRSTIVLTAADVLLAMFTFFASPVTWCIHYCYHIFSLPECSHRGMRKTWPKSTVFKKIGT